METLEKAAHGGRTLCCLRPMSEAALWPNDRCCDRPYDLCHEINWQNRDLIVLPPFAGPSPHCPKCLGVTRTEHRRRDRSTWRHPREFLRRTCLNCAFHWDEQVAPPQAPTSPDSAQRSPVLPVSPVDAGALALELLERIARAQGAELPALSEHIAAAGRDGRIAQTDLVALDAAWRARLERLVGPERLAPPEGSAEPEPEPEIVAVPEPSDGES